MRLSEYFVARFAITLGSMAAAAGVVGVVALFIAPWIGRQLGVLIGASYGALLGMAFGLVVVILVPLSLRSVLGYTLAAFDTWAGRKGVEPD